MTKKEITIALSGFAAAIVLIGGGLLWHAHTNDKHKAEAKQTIGNHEISLNQSDDSSNSGGLSVSSGGASDLGQLGGNQSQKSASNGSGGNGTDTSSFAQYDKYKDSKDALFGDIQKGTGADLTKGKKATIYYKAYLTNGTLVDQSPASPSGQRQPYSFTMGAGQVIPGLEEGTYGMKAGGTRLVIIPPAVGYGSQGQGAVPPNAVLVFQVQLISVQ